MKINVPTAHNPLTPLPSQQTNKQQHKTKPKTNPQTNNARGIERTFERTALRFKDFLMSSICSTRIER